MIIIQFGEIDHEKILKIHIFQIIFLEKKTITLQNMISACIVKEKSQAIGCTSFAIELKSI